MKKIFVLVVPVIFYFSSTFCLDLVPYIKACHRNDPNLDQCGIESAKKAIPELVKGDPIYNIPKMNPMFIESINLAPVSNLLLSMRNITVKGLEKAAAKNIHFNLTTRNIQFEIFVPKLDISGQYSLKGSLLIFPIEGHGYANIIYVNGTYTYKMHYELIERKKIKYINTTQHNVDLICERAYFQFDNLFNGNKLLGDQILRFMNDNWQDVNKDFGPYIAQAIDSIAFYTSHSILIRVPHDQIFLP